MFETIMSLSVAEALREAQAAYFHKHQPNKLSVSLYSRGPRCNADCGFCAWNRNFVPVPGEIRTRLTTAEFSAKVDSLLLARAMGLHIHTGVILGLGETEADRGGSTGRWSLHETFFESRSAPDCSLVMRTAPLSINLTVENYR